MNTDLTTLMSMMSLLKQGGDNPMQALLPLMLGMTGAGTAANTAQNSAAGKDGQATDRGAGNLNALLPLFLSIAGTKGDGRGGNIAELLPLLMKMTGAPADAKRPATEPSASDRGSYGYGAESPFRTSPEPQGQGFSRYASAFSATDGGRRGRAEGAPHSPFGEVGFAGGEIRSMLDSLWRVRTGR